jgi:hypothetical protein
MRKRAKTSVSFRTTNGLGEHPPFGGGRDSQRFLVAPLSTRFALMTVLCVFPFACSTTPLACIRRLPVALPTFDLTLPFSTVALAFARLVRSATFYHPLRKERRLPTADR